jgi:hypothetical protein
MPKKFPLQISAQPPAGLSGLLAQLALPAQLSSGTHSSPTSSQNQCRHCSGPTPPRLHRPGRHGCPSSRRQSSPSSFTPWLLLPPSSHALTHYDEPKITQSLNTTVSPAVTLPSPPRRPSPSPIKGPLPRRNTPTSLAHPLLLSVEPALPPL